MDSASASSHTSMLNRGEIAMDYMRQLARKGKVTVVEHTGGKTQVAIQAYGGVVTLEGGTKESLLKEMCQMTRNWPDTPSGQPEQLRRMA